MPQRDTTLHTPRTSHPAASQGEDIYGRTLDTSSNIFLHFPDAAPSPWPPRDADAAVTSATRGADIGGPTICARLLRSGSIKQKSW